MRQLSRLIFIVLLLLHTSNGGRAQSPSLAHYTTENGLPSNTVYGITRDARGFLWFCTDKGICRYNGVRFQYYNFRDGIPDNEVFSAIEDKAGRLWFSTFNGELCFYKDGIFHTAQNTSYLKLPFKAPFISAICPHEDSSVSFVFHNQSRFVTITGDKYTIYDLAKLDPQLPFTKLERLTRLSASSYEIRVLQDIIVFDTSMNIIHRSTLPHNRHALNGPQPYLYDDHGIYTKEGKQLVLFKSKPGLMIKPRFFIKEHNWSLLSKPGLMIKPRFFIKEHNWSLLGTFDGLILNDSVPLLPHARCSSFAKDINGNYWIGTLKDGVYKIKSAPIAPLEYKNVVPERISYASATAQGLFFITQNNILYSMKKGRISELAHVPPESGEPIENFYFSDTLNNHYIFRGTDAFVLQNNSSGKVSVTRYRGSLPYVLQWKTAIRSGNKIFLRCPNDIFIWDYDPQKKAGSTLGLRTVKGHPNHERIFSITKDSSGAIWYTTLNQIYKIINDSAVAQRQWAGTSFRWIGIEGAYMIGITHQNRLLICTGFDSSPVMDTVQNNDCVWSNPFRIDQTHMIFPTNNVYHLLTLHAPNNRAAYSIHALDDPYIPSDAQFICADKENCYFFKQSSIYSTPISSLLSSTPPPTLFFTSVRTANRVLNTNLPSGTAIDIPYHLSRNLKISFAVLSFNSKDVFYEYSLSDKLQDRWLPIQSEEINLLEPGYGNYLLKVRVRNHSDNFSKPQYLQIHILKPFWAKTWFILAAILILSTLVIILVRGWLRRLIKKRERQHDTEIRLLKSEYKALNALMNPHFIFNSLNNIQSLINENDKLHANEYLNDFSKLIRQNMQNISHELIPLQKEITLVEHYLRLEKLRFKQYLNYEIEVSDLVESDLILIPPLLIQPLVENAIKHGLLPRPSSSNLVTVKVLETDMAVRVEVQDNGIGFQPQTGDGQHESMGLKTLNQRIEHLRQISGKHVSFEIQSPVNANKRNGTTVIITIDY